MPSCNFTAANLNQADLTEAMCSNSDFTQSQLIGSKLFKVNAKLCRFIGTDLSVRDIYLSK